MHFGAPDPVKSREREKHFVLWLESIADQASDLFLLGDLFDFWFEYRRAVPKGYVRFLGALAKLADSGVKIHIFPGNHDLWYHNYLEEELGATIYREPLVIELFGKKFYLAHGDGLGPGDQGYKLMKSVFIHPLSKWLFSLLHPDLGIRLALWLSSLSGDHNYEAAHLVGKFTEAEWIFQHANHVIASQPDINCFVFGHRHVLVRQRMHSGAEFIILGDWIQYFSYLELKESGMELRAFPMSPKTEAHLNTHQP
jgi:UDP-2,3-diacylglucosamine hydrolase